ncbi:MAG: anti-sigma factor [Planctomycetota bacterium]
MKEAHVTCKDLAEKLLLFRDGDLGEYETEHLRQHIHLCPMCFDLLQSYEEVVDVLHRLAPVDPPPGFLERMKERLGRAS